jgi:hypothetical protein
MVIGVQGRLVPLYAYYRAMMKGGGAIPARGANALPSAPLAGAIFMCWTLGVPWLGFGLAADSLPSIRGASLVLFAGACIGALYLGYMLRQVNRTESTKASAPLPR